MSNYNDFVSLDFGQMREDESRFGKGKRINRLKINIDEGKVIRFLRASTDPKFYIIRKQHWGIPIGVGKTPPQACAKAYSDNSCYYCDMVNEYYNSGDPRKQSLARRMKASSSVMSNVIDVKDAVNDDGTPKVQIWQYSWKVFQDIMGYFKSPDYGDLTHPVTGRNFKVRCEEVSNQGDRKWTKYIVQVGANPTEIDTPEALSHLYDLEATFPLKFYTYEEQKGIFDGSFDPRGRNSTPSISSGEPSKQIEQKTEAVEEGVEEEFETDKFEDSSSEASGDWDDLVEESDESDEKKSDIMQKLEELKKVAKG